MELRQLKYFLKVAETLNFSTAAKELFITQSTLSSAILHLEQELGQQLFCRNSHEVVLTEAGAMLMPLALKTVNAAGDCTQIMEDLRGIQTGELNIGITFSFRAPTAETMIDFLKRYPRVKMNVCYASMEELMNKLMRHELDLVLAFRPTACPPRIESRAIFNNRLAAIVRKHHPIASMQSVTLEQLERYDLALPSRGMQARSTFDRMLEQEQGHVFRIRVEMNNVHLLFKLIRSTQYVTILSTSTVIDEPDLCAIPIDGPGGGMQGCIHTLRDAYMKHSAREFIRMLGQDRADWPEATEVLRF